MSHSTQIAVSVSRPFSFSAEQVFDAWLDPVMARHWFAPTLGEMVRIDIDPREGGGFHLDQQRGDDLARHWGTYRKLFRPHLLVFTWCVDEDEEPTVVTVDIATTATGCLVTVTHDLDERYAEYREQCRDGWSTILDDMHVGLIRESPPAEKTLADTLQLERKLPASRETVWAWLTESGKRAAWLAGGGLPGREGEFFSMRFHHAELSPEPEEVPTRFRDMADGVSTRHCLLQFNPPGSLQMSWDEEGEQGPSEVTLTLTPEGDRTRLMVRHTLLPDVLLPDVAAGWHTHLAILTDRLASVAPRPFWTLFEPLQRDYQRRFRSLTG